LPFQLPIKGDIDRTLSNLMHDARHRLMIEKNRIMGEAAQAGALHGNRVIITVANVADQIHDAAMKQATPILLDFIARMQLPPAEITEWARPHLENLGNSLLGLIPPNNFPADHKRVLAQYHAVFQQRLDGVLRDVEIGFVKGSGFSGTTGKPVEWISAADAVALLESKANMISLTARKTICARAHDGLIRGRALRFVHGQQAADNVDIPLLFWWARGEKALTQNWAAGDFETWIEHELHLKAYGVTFARPDIEKLIPKRPAADAAPAAQPAPTPAKGGRPPADWWEDLLIELCFRHFRGELQPKTQADIERAMHDWITERGYEAADSTIRIRARKVWNAIKRDAEN
jgi:hypothetical protein